MMTALLFVESRLPFDGVATISPNAARATGTRLKLRAGEQMRAADLLAATLLVSANDACLALAEHTAGSKDQFNAAMNRRAKELGLTNSNFTNPCGHDEPKHRSSARDLAEISAKTIGGRTFKLENSNELLGRYTGALGVKTGYTPGAGNCLIAMAERNGLTVSLVVLNAPNRWWESVAVLDRAFDQARAGTKSAK
jgi:serine-type D-Ala-D-Ala carboxypeptidase (penicillin-binding protein 5/6)